MALTNLQSTVWTSTLLTQLQKSLVFGQDAVIGKGYQVDISADGKEAHIHGLNPVSIGNYTKYTNVTTEQLTDTRQTLLIDQQKYFSFEVDDVDDAQSKPNPIPPALDDAAYGLAQAADAYIAGLYANATSVTTAAYNADNIYGELVKAAVQLDKANVPSDGRFVIISPDMKGLLLNSPEFQAAASASVLNGAIGAIAGFSVLVSNNVVVDAAATPDQHKALAGHPIAWTFASQIRKVESFRNPDRFGEINRGLFTFGAKVIRPTALLNLNAGL
jgi:hypothetical protein